MWKFHRGSPYENLINFLDFGYGFWILDTGFWILDTGFWRFWILCSQQQVPGFLQNIPTSNCGGVFRAGLGRGDRTRG
jgi:hypothetical protein